jgi:tetratricopeptide (TPR) repeat protein
MTKWLLAFLMLVPLGSCVSAFRYSARIPGAHDDADLVLFSVLFLAAVGVWLGLIVFVFRSPRVKRQHRYTWLFALTAYLPLSAPIFFYVYLWRSPEEKATRPPDSNLAHLVKIWAVIGGFGAFLLAGLTAAFLSGRYLMPVVALMIVPAVFILIRVKQWRLRRLLTRGDPDQILTSLSRQLQGSKWMPHGDCLQAGTLAAVAATMGEFARARGELGAVHWERRPPLYQGLRDSVMAQLALFDEHDSGKALALARSARTLADVPGVFPGSARSRASLDATVAALELLSGDDRPELVTALETMVRKLPEAQRALPACALCVHHAGKGDSVRAEQFREQLTRLAPHARPLLEMAGAPTQGSPSAASASSSWPALLRSVSLPVAALAGLVALAWVLPPDKAQVRHSRPVTIPSPAAADREGPTARVGSGKGDALSLEALPEMIREAEAAIDEGEDDRAIQVLDEVLRVAPDDADALFYRAYAYDNKRDYVRAIQDLDRVLRLKPDNAAAFDNRGLAYLNLGDFDRAIVDFDEAIRLQPSNPIAFNSRGAALLDKEDYPAAIRDFDEAIRLRPGFAEAIQGREKAVRRKFASEHPIRSLLSAFRQE